MSLLVTFPLAGHHNKDSGAVYNGRFENKENQRIRNKINESLKTLGTKFISDNDNQTLSEVIRTIKPGSASVLYEAHLDAAVSPIASGTTCVVSNESYMSKDLSYKMAFEIADVTSKILGIRNRGVIPESKTARGKLAILHTKSGVSVLHEWCFITNKEDMKALDNSYEKVCLEIAKILKKYDDLK
ncbi:MAG: N-acetylmuramoyl-L-alanine amidase [Bergeyella sp.]